MRYPSQDSIAWQFDTANFRIVFHTDPCADDPADQFQFQGDIDAVRSGRVAYFDAFVSVWFGDDPDSLTYLAHDSLSGCAYNTIEEFYTSHRDRDPSNRNTLAMKARKTVICHYFPDMVRVAVSEARKNAGLSYRILSQLKSNTKAA